MEHQTVGAGDAASARNRIERETASQVALLVRRELGLTPCSAEAELGCGRLTVRLRQALTPTGRLIAQAEGGSQIVQGAYEVLYEACCRRLHTLVVGIVGLPVRRSWIEVDSAADVLVQFDFSPSLLPTETRTPRTSETRPRRSV